MEFFKKGKGPTWSLVNRFGKTTNTDGEIEALVDSDIIITNQIYTLMGHQISSERQFGVTVKQGIQEKYLTNLFLKNRKSSRQFQKELDSVCKRSSYLNYDWAQSLLTELRTCDPNQLYSEYQTTLKENCLREGKKEKIFCPGNISRQFITLFGRRVKDEDTRSAQWLQEAFEQTKCYFMVMSWLHKMVTLSANDKENKNSCLTEDWDLTEEQKIYEILLVLAQRTYRQMKEITPFKQCERKLEPLSFNLTCLVKKLTGQRLKFFEKEGIIFKIQEEIMSDSNNIDTNVRNLKKIISDDVIYGYLRTIRQVGHIDISPLWKLFGEELS